MDVRAGMVLENAVLRVEFDHASGSLCALQNKLTGETYDIAGDEFAVKAVEFTAAQHELEMSVCTVVADMLLARYAGYGLTVDVRYTLGEGQHFVEKRLTITSARAYGLRQVVVSQSQFIAEGMQLVCCRHPNFDRVQAHDPWGNVRPPGLEPVRTYFGRTELGGFFTGIELPFDSSTQEGDRLLLGYAPNMKVAAGVPLACEPLYLGVYRRQAADEQAAEWRPADDAGAAVLPLPSESAAMVAMTSALLGPPRHGLVAMACGWHSEMEQNTYTSKEAVATAQRSLDFLAECGVDWLSDSHPWGGETEKMNVLAGDVPYTPGPLVCAVLDHAKRLNIKVVMWPTMNNTQPWSPLGKPFRPDRPDWLRVPPPGPDDTPHKHRTKAANCLAHMPFFDWLTSINLDGLATGYYGAWCMDGDFWGTGAYFNTTLPVECQSGAHDHLPGDANYACERALNRLTATVRTQYPNLFICMCRPAMDLGCWSQWGVDACFTLIETGTGTSNLAGGDEIRVASRIRVHHHFFPHYLDWPLLFPSYCDPQHKPAWPSAKIDYLMLSALSCSPNLLLYLPTQTGIPAEDKAEIRHWLEWGRAHLAYLQVRKDLPTWPAPGKVDGSAHLLGDHGLIFLFNSSEEELTADFALTEEGIGLTGAGVFTITQEYPATAQYAQCEAGETVSWTVPGESAVVLRIAPAE